MVRRRKILLTVQVLAVWFVLSAAGLVPHLMAGDFPSSSQSGDASVLAMGGVSTGLIENSHMQTMNPAALFFRSERRFRAGVGFLDTFDLSQDPLASLDAFLTSPSLSYHIHYTANSWSLGAYSDFCLDKKASADDSITFDVERLNGVELNFAFGTGFLAFGVDFRASKRSYLNNQVISMDADPLSVVSGLIQRVFLAEFPPGREESLEMGLGMMIDAGNFTFGLNSDSVLDFMPDSGSGVRLDPDEMLKTLDAGAVLSSNPYSMIGRLRLIQVRAALDMKNIGDTATRSFHAGLTGTLLLSNRLSFTLSAGYMTDVPDFRDILSTETLQDSILTGGISADLVFMTIHTALMVPWDFLGAPADQSRSDSVAETIAGSLSFSFFL